MTMTSAHNLDLGDQILTTGDVAALFRVDQGTVRRWATTGVLPFFETPGGQYRFHASDIRQYVSVPAQPTPAVAS